MPAAISVQGLTKRYGRVAALAGVTFQVAAGETLGFLGPNGAGKTTTIRLLLDLLRPTSGRAEIFGLDCRRRSAEARKRVGYLPGDLTLYGDMTGEQVLDLLARLSGLPEQAPARASVVERLELSPADLRRKIREYSTGMRRKIGIVQAFQHEPELLILDEPTEGLDPLMQDAFRTLVDEARARGATLFISSHVLGEVDRLCDCIVLLREGKVVLTGAVEEVRRLVPRVVTITFAAAAGAPPPLPERYEIVRSDARAWCVRTRGELGDLLAAAAPFGIRDVDIDSPRLEDVIVAFYKGEER